MFFDQNRLKYLVEKSTLSRDEIAVLSHLSQSGLYKLLHSSPSELNPTLKTIRNLSKALGTTPEALVTNDSPSDTTSHAQT